MLPSSIRGGLLVLLLVATCAYAQEAEAAEETAVEDSGIPEGVNCGDGLLIPIWRPYDNLSGK